MVIILARDGAAVMAAAIAENRRSCASFFGYSRSNGIKPQRCLFRVALVLFSRAHRTPQLVQNTYGHRPKILFGEKFEKFSNFFLSKMVNFAPKNAKNLQQAQNRIRFTLLGVLMP